MNKENLQRMADHIRTIPQELFDMEKYRADTADKSTPTCNSVGCVIGHCTVLDAPENLPRISYQNQIDFDMWSEQFAGFEKESLWLWCFGSTWSRTDNTPIGAAARIEWLIKNGLPENWNDQMRGYAPLCYKS